VSEAGPLYVYGVVAAGDAPSVDAAGVGEDGAGIRTVSHGELAAVVSEVEDGPLAAARDLRAHWRVLEEVAAETTVVPVRFGTVIADERALVEDFLAPQSEHLTALVNELRGKVQLNVKAFYDEEQLLRDVVAGSPAVAQLRERVQGMPEAAGYYDRIRLGELVSAEVERRRNADSALVVDRLAPLAVAAHSEGASTADMAVNAAFLVESSAVETFSSEVGALTEELGERMRIRYVGPMPPYSFADAESAGSPAWA
jgi:Gas vesicle synthesis protein GvpL/GvpF